ncbi:MAG: GGDEF domain-containing protein [Eubacteriales bacterium]|nr:GGDEF domain-containing protein [Eubacteriales bacterium]
MNMDKDINVNHVDTSIKPLQWCRYIVKAGYATAIVIILAHVIWYFAARSVLISPADYLRYYIIWPAIGILALNVLVDYLVRSNHVSLLTKEYLVLSLFVVFSFYLCITHKLANVLFGSFVLSVFASTIFSNIKITRWIFLLSSFALLISGMKVYFFERFNGSLFMTMFVAWNMLLCSYLLSKILIRFGQNNLSSLMHLYQKQASMQEQLKLDPFTGLYNRKTFDTYLCDIMEECKTTSICVSLAIVDVDRFKRLNDNYGHAIGDRVLLHTAQILRGNQIESINAFRIGGDEFALIFKDYAVKDAYKICEGMRSIMETSSLHEIDKGSITFSCGLACMDLHYANPEKLAKAADAALYKAKNNGRNQVVIYDAPLNCAD